MNDELPGMLAVAKGIAEQRWPHTMDAKVWADEFVKLNPSADHGLMLGWFANAIMAGYDTAQSRAGIASETKAKVPPAPCSDELWEEIMDFLRDHEDVVDGSDGESLPNNAMRILQRIDNGGR